MPSPKKDGIETIEEDDPRNNWPMTVKVMATTGMRKATIENHVRAGTLKYVYDQHGERRFDPESVQEITGLVSDKDIDADVTKHVIEQLRKGLEDTTKANRELLKLATEPSHRVMVLLRRENRALRGRCRDLEARHLKNIEAFETALNASHERELSRMAAEAKEKRYDAGFNKLLEQLPNIVAQVTFKKSIDTLLDSFTDEQKQLLFEMLTGPQKALLFKLMKQAGSTPGNTESRSQPDPTDSGNSQSGN